MHPTPVGVTTLTEPKSKSRSSRIARRTTTPGTDAPRRTSEPTLGRLLHSLRSQRGWTLKEMSERTGIPFSTLSKVENDRLTLSYDKLQQLGERLGLRMSELFAEPEPAPAAFTARRSVGTLDNAVRVNTQNYDYYYLCTELRQRRIVPIYAKVRAHSVGEFGPLVRHSGEEWIYVLEGRVEIHTEFYDKLCLEAGQSVYIDSTMGHAILVGEGCAEATIIGACSSAQEEHLREIIDAHAESPSPEAPARPRRP